jgi:hypothetical protein
MERELGLDLDESEIRLGDDFSSLEEGNSNGIEDLV